VLFPVRGAWVTSGEPSGSMVDGLMLYATKRTMKIAFGTLKPIFFGGLIVGTVALQTPTPKPHAQHRIDVTGSLQARKTKEPTAAETFDKLLRALDPFAPSK
jgi:hypothetical protein